MTPGAPTTLVILAMASRVAAATIRTRLDLNSEAGQELLKFGSDFLPRALRHLGSDHPYARMVLLEFDEGVR